MGVGPAVFQSAGQRSEHWVPGAYSRSAAVGGGGGISAGNGVILGKSLGGKPQVVYTFSTVAEAKETLVDGELLKAVSHAFNPSPDYAPQRVLAMRVNPGTQAERTMKAETEDVLHLKSSEYGVHTNRLKMQLTAGTNPGTRKAAFVLGDMTEKIDNIGKKSLSLQYIGEGSTASLTIDNLGVTIEVTGAEDGVVIPFEDFPTVDELVARLNDTGVFSAVQLELESNVPSFELDAVTGVDVKTSPVILKSDFYALYHALENSYFVGSGNVEKVEGALNTMPDNDPDPVYFEGAVDGTYTAADWNEALVALEAEDIQIISTPSTDAAVHTLIANHCTAMSNVQNRKERTALLGGPIGETIDAAKERAAAFNNKLISYLYPWITVQDPITGAVEELPASYLACKGLGMEATLAVNEPMTWKNVSVLKFGKKLRVSDMENLIRGGVLCCGTTDDNRLAVIRAMTTYQGDKLQLAERSMVREDLYMNRDLRNRYSAEIGHPDTGSGDPASTLASAARDWKDQGLIHARDDGSNVWGVVVSVKGDKTYITFNRYLTAPKNFFFVTAMNYVYGYDTAEVGM